MATEHEPTGGVADVMALQAQSEDFVSDTVEAYEALSRRVKAVETSFADLRNTLLEYFEGNRDDLKHFLELQGAQR